MEGKPRVASEQTRGSPHWRPPHCMRRIFWPSPAPLGRFDDKQNLFPSLVRLHIALGPLWPPLTPLCIACAAGRARCADRIPRRSAHTGKQKKIPTLNMLAVTGSAAPLCRSDNHRNPSELR